MGLTDWGWDAHWEELVEGAEGAVPARVSSQERTLWAIEAEVGSRRARIPNTPLPDGPPAVGDWVLATPAESSKDPWLISAILPRRSKFSRKVAGHKEAEQVIAANVDRLWILHGLDLPMNPRRIERYLTVAWESGAVPEIVLTKADLVPDGDEARRTLEPIAQGVSVWLTTTRSEGESGELGSSLVPGQTVALLGPSGVGKSSLVNHLAGESLLAEGEVREGDRKGRHTTTRRQLVRLRQGALLLDTPGMREMQLWEVDEGLETTFPEIDELAGECRFGDCRHASEPGCAVLAGLAAGKIDPERLDSYRKLEGEARHQRMKADPAARSTENAKVRTIMKAVRRHPKHDR